MLLRLKDRTYEIEGIIFDKDGTLLDSESFWPVLLETRMGKLREQGVAEHVISNCCRTLGLHHDRTIDYSGPFALASRGEEMLVTSTVLYQNGYRWDKARKMVEKAYDKAEEELDMDKITKLFPGVKDLLKELKDRGLKLAVATADAMTRAERMLHSAGLIQYIDLLVAREMVKEGKPKPDMLKYISMKFNIPCNKMAMVGDTSSDMEMAAAAGCIGIGVLTGEGSRESMEDVAVEIIEDVTMLKDFIE